MGLMDILNGMQNGPRGAKPPAGSSTSSGSGMSPITMALLGLLAYKAMKHFGGSSGTTPATPSLPPGGGTTSAGQPGGSLGDVLGGLLGGKPGGSSGAPGGGGLGDVLGGLLGGKPGGSAGAPGGGLGDVLGGLLGGKPGGAGGLPGGLGGLLAGGAAGSVLSGGLDKLLKDLQSSGHGTTAQSWVGKGDNEEIAPGDLEKALGADAINALTNQTGMSRSELLDGLSKNLPELVDQLTPDGRLPTEHEAARW